MQKQKLTRKQAMQLWLYHMNVKSESAIKSLAKHRTAEEFNENERKLAIVIKKLNAIEDKKQTA